MELINLERVLPKHIQDQIESFLEYYANGEDYKVMYGQLFIGQPPMEEDVIIGIIKNMVCDFYKSSKSIVLSSTRKQPYMKYRQIISYMINKYTDMPLSEIGMAINNQTHATIINSLTAVNNYIRTDNLFAKELERLDERLRLMLIEKAKPKNITYESTTNL